MEPLILIVEDSQMFGKLLERSVVNHLGYATKWTQSYAETETYLETHPAVSFAVLDLILPDSLSGEIVDLVRGYDIPCVAITGNYSDDLQEFVWSKQIVDYIIKEGPQSIQYTLDVIERVTRNEGVGILVVDDSRVARMHIRSILTPQRYTVYEAGSGAEALEHLASHPDIKLVLTDYAMPDMNGFELTQKIRQTYPLEKLAIIGLSASGNHRLTVKFIKHGANDFLSKPFVSDMLYCRINLNLKIVEQFSALRQVTLIDHLTSVNNRRYLFEAGDIIFDHGRRTGDLPVVAMIDIDDFKRVNDSYGHDTGDEVIRRIAETLQLSIRKSDVLSRYGGEEFCIVCRNMAKENAKDVFDLWREKVAGLEFSSGSTTFNVSISIGVCTEPRDSFLEMIKAADENLLEAKRSGKNRVCV